jgi:hypothetical protein
MKYIQISAVWNLLSAKEIVAPSEFSTSTARFPYRKEMTQKSADDLRWNSVLAFPLPVSRIKPLED